jgi:hypothetical protein
MTDAPQDPNREQVAQLCDPLVAGAQNATGI